MKPLSWRAQLWVIGLGYAAVLAIAAVLLFARHLQELYHAADVAAAGGMYAFGDLLLYIFIAGLFMIPTIFLVWAIAKFEAFYTTYSQLLLALSLSAPVCLGLFSLGVSRVGETLSSFCLYRLFWSPFVLAGMGVSRLVARFHRAKKLTSYALLIEGLTLVIAVVALLIHR